MTYQPAPIPFRRFALSFAAAFCVSLTACGGGGGDDQSAANPLAEPQTREDALAARGAAPAAVATTNTLQVAITIPGFPHTVDVYRPAGATKAIVFLHGLGGYTGKLAYDFGLNSIIGTPTMNTVNWAWLAQNGVMAIFPQGQIPPGSALPTWSDYVQQSGADDVGFLKALSSYVKTQYGATEVSLSGHSNGGAMAARIWCEASASYKAFVSLAGPMPSSTFPIPAATCTPQTPAPYYVVIGGADTTLLAFSRGAHPPTAQQIAVGLTNSILTSEWTRHHDRSQKVCGEVPVQAPTSVATYGPTWNACGSHVRYTVVTQADHPIASLEQYTSMKMADLIRGFVQ